MKTCAIISEFNPFHNGHKLLVDWAKENGADKTIAIMSGSFLQRGQPSLFSKFARTKCALENGIDLVIELPVIYANSSANIFAYGGVDIANKTGVVDTLIFGSECGKIESLYNVLEVMDSDIFKMSLKKELDLGKSYARACNDTINKISPDLAYILKTANNTLALEYIRALIKTQSTIKAETLTRQGAMHDTNQISDNIASASHIRDLICNKQSYNALLPKSTFDILQEEINNNRIINFNNFEKTLYYKLVSMSKDNLKDLPDVIEGLENRLYKAIRNNSNITDIIDDIKTKRYTTARIRRILMCAYIGITKENITKNAPYIRVLGFNENGKSILKDMKEKANVPIITKINANKKQLTKSGLDILELDILANDLQSINFKTPAKCGEDYYISHIRI